MISRRFVHSGVLTIVRGLNGLNGLLTLHACGSCIPLLSLGPQALAPHADSRLRSAAEHLEITNFVLVQDILRSATDAHVRRWMAEFVPCKAYRIAPKKVDVQHQALSTHAPGSEDSGSSSLRSHPAP